MSPSDDFKGSVQISQRGRLMSQTEAEKRAEKEQMKKLREDRKPLIKAAVARMKKQRKEIKDIREQLNEKGGTVPEIAMATGIPSAQIMWYLASLKRYGRIVEAEKDGSYFRYESTGFVESE
jgi:hypothetical protein